MTKREGLREKAHWIWVFGEIEALRWVLDHKHMAFGDHARARANRIAKGDRAILYVTRGAHHNPTRDRARFRGIVTATSHCSAGDPVGIAGREFKWTCRFRPELMLPERSGPFVHELVEDLQRVKRPEVWGQYFRQSPIEVAAADFELIARTIHQAAEGTE